ncbi:MAG: L,D-transpeptidase family protein [Akkermansiaceae bacterium]|nr:L,D-transpeptidase family protein [Akkermansiaceae bacterium]
MNPFFKNSALAAVVAAVGFGSVSAFRPWESGVQRDLRRLGVEVSEESLHEALGRGDRAMARMLLEAGVAPAGRDEDGRTPLMLALANHDPGLARVMIEAGANLIEKDADGQTVLGHAVRAGEVSIVKELLERGADPDVMVPEGGNLTVHATEAGRTAAAKLMLEAGATPRGRGSDGTPIAFHAVKRGLHWMLREILEAGEQVETRDPAGDTLLHAGARQGDMRVAALLWEHGAKPDWRDSAGRTALHLAMESCRGDFAADLVAKGASVEERDPAGFAPLHLATRHGGHACLRALLQARANPEAADPDGHTALDLALQRRDFEAAQILFDYGAAPRHWLLKSVTDGDHETFDFLMGNGVDANPEGTDSPLAAAVRGEDERMVMILLDAGARHDVAGREGQQPLHLALARDAGAIVRDLIAHGADVNEPFGEGGDSEFIAQVKSDGFIKWHLRNDKRVTPLMMAADRKDLEMARLLLDHGAKTSIYTSRHRYWPIGMAARRQDVKMMKLLLGRDPERNERWAKVDLSQQRAWVYNEAGKTIYSTRISSGMKGYRTRTGEFVVTNKIRHHVSNIYKGAKMPYFQRFSCGDFGFHEGYVPGYPASHGCLRVPPGAARKMWGLLRTGDKVVIVP